MNKFQAGIFTDLKGLIGARLINFFQLCPSNANFKTLQKEKGGSRVEIIKHFLHLKNRMLFILAR